MLRIVSHLEKLLMVHDCVIVPKFGGFVLQTISASYNAERHLFTPMHKEIVFNSTLMHNDGLLAESYMKMYDVNYQRAYKMLEEDVDDIHADLYKGVRLLFGTIGSFYKGYEGQFIFESGGTELFSMESYGLSSCHIPTLRSLQREEVALLTKEEKSRRDIFYIPVNKRLLRGMTATAAAIALFLMVSTPIKEVNADAYTASFIPTEMVTAKPTPKVNDKKERANANVTEISVLNEANIITAAKPKPQKQEKKIVPGYYVIISSINSDKKADDFLSRMDRSVYKNAGKILGTGMVRIYADRFDSKEQAETYMAKLRRDSNFYDAWVYTAP